MKQHFTMIGFLVWCFFLKHIHATKPADIASSIDPTTEVEIVLLTPLSSVTLYTTLTYLTTLFVGNTTILQSNLETKTNVITEPYVKPSSVEPMLTTYTTFTYWTTYSNADGLQSVTSREETLTNIAPASKAATISVTEQLNEASSVEQTQGPDQSSVSAGKDEDMLIQSTMAPAQTGKGQYEGDETLVETILSTSGPVSTSVPEIQSGEPGLSVISVTTIATPISDSTITSITPTSSFEDLDNDLTFTSDSPITPTSVRERGRKPRKKEEN